MIARKNKFPMRTGFLHFRTRAHRITTSHFTVYFQLSTTNSHLSVVVPKKMSKLATVRNWLKRLTYDTLWPTIKDKNSDCVVVYKPLPLIKSGTTKQSIMSEISTLTDKLTIGN